MTNPRTPTWRSLSIVLLALAACNLPPKSPPTERPRDEAAPVAVETKTARPPAQAPRAPAATAVAAQTPAQTVERLIELGRSDNRVQEHLRHLSFDIGPRLTSSTNLQRACEWTRDQFKSFGLTAEIEYWGDFEVGFDRGPWHGGMVAPEKQDFEFHTMAWTPGTDGAKRGRALRYPTSEEELTAMQDKIAGAWIVRPPANELKDSNGAVVFAKPEQPANDLIEKVQDAIVAHGGLGEVRGSRGELLVTDGNSRITWDQLPKLVSIRVRKDHHDGLWQRLTKDEPVELEFAVDNRFVQGPVKLYNVVADLKGATKPDEYVIVCGHLDSWDGAQGTVDNGTGCATTLEAARLLVAAGAKPARTIRFILWSGEEQGLLGSRAYVKAHPELISQISAVFNHDEGTNYLSGLSVTKAMMPAMQQVCAPLMDLNPDLKFELREVDGLASFGASDHASFTQAGVPGFFWRQSGRSNYEHHHHTQYDTFDAAIPEYQEHSALVAALVAYNVANLPELLDRTNMKAPDPRRMGVELDDTRITRVMDEGRAKDAGLLAGDVVLSIDGKEIKSRGAISEALRGGGSKKVFAVKRGDQTVEATLDWSSESDEPRRLAGIKEREARDAARKAEEASKKAAENTPAEGTSSKP